MTTTSVLNTSVLFSDPPKITLACFFHYQSGYALERAVLRRWSDLNGIAGHLAIPFVKPPTAGRFIVFRHEIIQ